MNKLLFTLSLFFAGSFSMLAQNYSNGWIDYSSNKRYLKFPVAQDGIYKIDYNTLDFAVQLVGKNLSEIDPRSIQLFARGEEQYIYAEGAADGSFDSGDFIEFYAEKNDGWLDEVMYPSASEHTNPYYSLYNDTIYYFLTWHTDGTQNSFRYTNEAYGTPASTPLNYFLDEKTNVFKEDYSAGKTDGSGRVPIVQYVGGKGWTSSRFGFNGSNNPSAITIASGISNLYTGNGAPNVTLDFALNSGNIGTALGNAHHVKLTQKNTTGAEFVLENYVNPSYYFSKESVSIAANSISNNVSFYLRSEPSDTFVSSFSDFSRVSYFKITYPKLPVFAGENFAKIKVPQSPINLFFNASSFSTSAVDYVYDLESQKRIEVQHNTANGNLKFNIPAGNERTFVIASSSAKKAVTSQIIRAVGSNGVFNNVDLQIEDAYLIITHSSLISAVQAYKTYRNQTYNAAIVDIEDLYDQFAYGIKRHPLAIRNFAEMAINEWPSKPKFLFLVGKSIAEAEFRGNSTNANDVLVPTMGFPPSDNSLTAGLDQAKAHTVGIPTGRIAAKTGADVAIYLQKIKAQENTQAPIAGAYTIDNKLWQKRILQFAGGDNVSENDTFKGYLNGYANYVTDSLMGAQRILFSKTSGDVIQKLDVDSVRDLIKEGVAMMTFFGHGSGNNFDVSVDNPSDWGNENEGRYPLVIANSCYSGNIHRPNSSPSISEEYVFTPNEGSIGFMATPDLSFQDQLNIYTNQFHKQLATTLYGKTVGEQMQAAANAMGVSEQQSGVALEMTLHGDPALKVFPHERPEITIIDPVYGPAIYFEPALITSDLDSFEVKVVLTNLGRSVTKSFTITASRYFNCANATPDEIQYKTLDALNFKDTLTFTFAVNSSVAVGQNCFDIEVDLPNTLINEFDNFGNNQITRQEVTISSTDIFPVFPYDYAVVPDFDVTLKANTGLPFLPEASYMVEIDTTDLYNSPWKKDTTITQSGAVISWNPSLASSEFADSTVFFWRVTPTSDLGKYKEHSFQVIQDKTGWGQDHFYQFEDDRFDFLNYSRVNRLVSFDSVARTLFVYCLANPGLVNNNAYLSNNRYTLDGQNAPLGETGVAPGGAPSILIAVFDSINLKPWGTYGISNGLLINQNHQFGNTNNYNPNDSRGRRVEYWFSFQVNSANGLNNAINLIQNEVPNGNYILMYTSVKSIFQDTTYWKSQHYSAFETLGADSIRYVGNNNPYIFLAKKGYPNTAIEVVGKNATDNIQLDTKVRSNIQYGKIMGTEVGPAMAWETAFFKHRALETNSADQAKIAVLNGVTEETIFDFNSNYETDISSVDAEDVSTLKLDYFTKDSIGLTAAQLSNWHVLYEPAPELAVNPVKGSLFPSKEVNVGADARFGVAFENVSDYGFGAFRVRYCLINNQREVVVEKWLNYDTLTAGEMIFDTVAFDTRTLAGSYTVWMEVNPEDSLWHKEQFHFNNTAFRTFSVSTDNQNPLLDVTFDGIHILNGDIVAPSPTIVMQLKDENQLLLLNDTSSFEVFLMSETAAQKRIPFIKNGLENMVFEPAVNTQNKARLTWNPDALADGKYTLSVIAKDASGNLSGNTSYKIDFEVINKSTVSNVMNYPNPFTTATRFVFTLTGSQIPDVFTIQIMTVTGKVVREITKAELGNIVIGRNITEYAWDGTDEFGDRLANGVYLYRVIMKIAGETIEHRASGADDYFIKDFGKMYLFR